MQALESTQTAVLERRRAKGLSDVAERKQELGQFLTPESIGAFMASLFTMYPPEIRLLDAGAGDGALITAWVKGISEQRRRTAQFRELHRFHQIQHTLLLAAHAAGAVSNG